jgi:hypothetical protein
MIGETTYSVHWATKRQAPSQVAKSHRDLDVVRAELERLPPEAR